MRKLRESMWVIVILMAFIVMAVILPGVSRAACTLPDICKKLDQIPPNLSNVLKKLNEIPPTWSKTLNTSERFVLVLSNEAVLDKETGLVWQRSLETGYDYTWYVAQEYCINLNVGNRKGWRLPTIQELSSLVDPLVSSGPSLPEGHLFENVEDSIYWSSTTSDLSPSEAWFVGMYHGSHYAHIEKDSEISGPVWCVRGGRGVDSQ